MIGFHIKPLLAVTQAAQLDHKLSFVADDDEPPGVLGEADAEGAAASEIGKSLRGWMLEVCEHGDRAVDLPA